MSKYRNNNGITAIEYASIASGIALFILTGTLIVGANIKETFCKVAADVGVNNSGKCSGSATTSNLSYSQIASKSGISSDLVDTSLGGTGWEGTTGLFNSPALAINKILSDLNSKDPITHMYGLWHDAQESQYVYTNLEIQNYADYLSDFDSDMSSIQSTETAEGVASGYVDANVQSEGDGDINFSNSFDQQYRTNYDADNIPMFDVTTQSGKTYSIEEVPSGIAMQDNDDGSSVTTTEVALVDNSNNQISANQMETRTDHPGGPSSYALVQ